MLKVQFRQKEMVTEMQEEMIRNDTGKYVLKTKPITV